MRHLNYGNRLFSMTLHSVKITCMSRDWAGWGYVSGFLSWKHSGNQERSLSTVQHWTIKNSETDTSLRLRLNLSWLSWIQQGMWPSWSMKLRVHPMLAGTITGSQELPIQDYTHMQQVVDGKIKNYDMFLMANDPSAKRARSQPCDADGTNPQLPSLSADRIKLQVHLYKTSLTSGVNLFRCFSPENLMLHFHNPAKSAYLLILLRPLSCVELLLISVHGKLIPST